MASPRCRSSLQSPPTVRQIPEHAAGVHRFRLCIFRPPSVCRWGSACTFAHSEEELTSWNRQKMTRERSYSLNRLAMDGNQMQSKKQLMSPQVQQQDSWPDPHTEYVPDPPRSKPPTIQTKSTFQKRSKELLQLEDLIEPLTITNYKKKFHRLLCWEEKEHITLLHDRCDGIYPITVNKQDDCKNFGFLHVNDGDIVAYATQASEAVYLVHGQMEVRADVQRDNSYAYTENRVYISMDNHFRPPHCLTEIEAQFEVKHSYFDSLHNVLSGLSDVVVRRLMPQPQDFDRGVRAEGIRALHYVPREHLNILHLDAISPEKQSAYQVALTCKSGSPPVLISGAFGTGKTCFLASVAYCFIAEADVMQSSARILICAHHQATADTVLTYFLPLMEHRRHPLNAKVIRIVPNSYIPKNKIFGRCTITVSTFKQIWMSVVTERKVVIITTFLTSFQLKDVIPSGFLTHILIDEGAQAREPEAVAPLCLADKDTKIIIAGDPRQVGPSLLVLGEEARKHGLKTSLLERLKYHYSAIGEKTRYLQANLMENYRCHKDIISFASQMFYMSYVKPSALTSSIKIPYGFSYPMVFVCTSIEQKQFCTDCTNEAEADILMDMLSEHIKLGGVIRVSVMSSSRGQVTLLRQKKLKHKMPPYVRVHPTFDIQGQEYDVLYISTCEATNHNGETRNPTKSTCDLYVFNTAITRARSLIISFGNPYLLMSIEKHMHLKYKSGHCWSQYLKMCLFHNTLIIPECVANPSHEKRLKERLMTAVDSLLKQETPSICGTPQKEIAAAPKATRKESTVDGVSKSANITRDIVCAPAAKQVHQEVKSTNRRVVPEPLVKLDRGQVPTQPKTTPTNHSARSQSRWPVTTPSFSQATAGSQDDYNKSVRLNFPTSYNRDVPKSFIHEGNGPNTTDFPTLEETKNVRVSKRQRRSTTSSQQDVEGVTVENTKYFFQYGDKLDERIFHGPLTLENYKKRFHHLLCWEEKEHMSILSERCNGRYLIQIFNQKPGSQRYYNTTFLESAKYSFYGEITSVDGNDDALAYAKQAGEAATITINGTKFKADFVASRMLTVGFPHKAHAPLKLITTRNRIECDVVFELKHSYFNRQHEALEALSNDVIQKLLPSGRAESSSPQRMNIGKCILELDSSGQMQALAGILQQRSTPLIIAGPFGTGKTRVLARAAYELIKQDQRNIILICTHHQHSADTFIEYFQLLQEEYRQFHNINIVRIETSQYHSRIKMKYGHYYCSVKAVSLRAPKIIVSTLGLSHHLRIKNNITHILIDEAAQTRETEAIIPLRHARAQTKIVLAGDHCQVGPNVLVLGEEARRNGLSTSLLERLHNHFSADEQKSCVFSLLQNYRSHSGLLMLPSALFYKSTLQCNVADAKAHPLAPFPLVFVCSSIEDTDTANAIGTDEKEADTLVKSVTKYVYNSWPEEWGERYDSTGTVCIMTPSATQRNLIARKLRAEVGERDKVVDVMKAYEIQGCEFTAVFLGTCETTDERGIPNNTTKTIINRYVFNTALTRAKYLVVAVGNPLQILRKEKRMHEIDPSNHSFMCWKEFIKRCVECKSFYLPNDVQADERTHFSEVLHQQVFSGNETLCLDNILHGDNDSILNAYKKKFQMIPECRRSKLKLSTVKSRLAWRINESTVPLQGNKDDDDEDKGATNVYNCRLNMMYFSKAEAIPLDPTKNVVHIRGKGNIRGAFHNDIVEVSTFNDLQYPDNKGRVLRVVKRCHKQTILCRAHLYNPTLFYPLDKKYPVFSNLPKLSRDLLEKKDKNMIDLELQSKDVVVFKPSSLTEGNIPEIENVIPFSLAQDMVFVIRILQWNPKYRLPLGAVIHAVPKGCSAFHAERLLMIEHNVQYEDETESSETESQFESKGLVGPVCSSIDTRAFTIDPEDAINLDDAISLWKKPDSYCLAVHIVNTTKAITLNDEMDKKAASKGQSIYGGKKIMNIIPLKKRAKLSLNPNQVCEVITVSANVIITECSVEIKNPQLKESKVRSCVKLSYPTAQVIMGGREYPSDLSQSVEEYDSINDQPNLKKTLQILFQIAMKLRRDRLGDSAAQSYEMDDGKERQCWQTHLLVEEMMIWANRHVAEKILSGLPHCALLRRQAPPNAEKFEATRSAHCNVAQYSQSISKYFQHLPPQPRSLVIPLSTLHALQHALKEGNEIVLLNILTDDSGFPQLNASSTRFRQIQQKAEYIATSSDTERESYLHNGLCLPVYTHFTSPLRRYADIIVQRMLRSFLISQSCGYSHKEVEFLCHILNGAAQNAKSFEKKMKALKLADEYTQSSEQYEAVVASNNKVEIEMSFLNKELKVIPVKNKRFKVRNLQCRTIESESQLYSWNVTLISFDENSSFPYDYEGISFNVGEAVPHDWTAAYSVPFSTMTFFKQSEKPDMLQEMTHNVKISPTATELSPAKWKQVKEFIQHPCKENLAQMQVILGALEVKSSKQASPFSNQEDSPVAKSTITCRMDLYDLIKVWMTWSTREGTLSPALQMIEITPFYRICLQHNAHPAECFSDSHLTNASKESYVDLHEYVSLWEKVLLAEAAQRSVRDNQTAIIYGAKLDWTEGKLTIPKEIGASHYEPKGPVYLILPSAIIDRAKPFFKIGVGDMVCVRYGTRRNSNIHAVFHFVITDIEKEDEGRERARLQSCGSENVLVSEKIKPYVEKEECEVQIIYMSKSYRRVYKVLLSLINPKAQVSELLKVVAKGKEDSRLKKVPKTQVVNCEHIDHNPKIRRLWSSQKLLNHNQWNALKRSLTQRFLLIQGPPGTGKSETGAHIAYALAMSNRDRGFNECVIYSAPTNKAVDVVLRTLDCLSKEINILRVYGKAVERIDFPGPYCNNEAFDASESGYHCPEWAQQYALHWKIRHLQHEESIELQQMEKMFSDEYKQGHIAGAVMYSKWKKLTENLETMVMYARFDIVLCTCNEAASGRIGQGLIRQGPQTSREKKTRVLQCIVDESGMAYEPETIVPMRLCEHVILLGDHQQLQPVIEYKPARENGLSTSLFERYAKSRKTELLTIQYRMHEEICRFPSIHFYEGKLITDASVKQRSNHETKLNIWPNGFNMPIMFCVLVGKESLDGLSKSNPDEAVKAVQIAQVLTEVYNVKLTEIALITPYKAQKKCLTELANNAGLSSLAIITITESQGDEYGIVILSTVRSQPLHEISNEDYVQPDRSWLLENLGFLTDTHEMNVGITRSKYGLIIIGNKTLLQYDENWGALIAHYEERKCVIDGSRFPCKRDLEQIG